IQKTLYSVLSLCGLLCVAVSKELASSVTVRVGAIKFNAVFAPLDTAVDVNIQHNSESISFTVMHYLHPHWVVLMVQQIYPLANESHRSFIQTATESYGSVFGHCAHCHFPKVVLNIFWSWSYTIDVTGKPF